MMTAEPDTGREAAFLIPCRGDWLLAIHHSGGGESEIGVVIVVGGPQYRVGSHRQFLELARYLAASGVPVLRFDYRGMGDSTGDVRTFEDIDADIRAAVDAIMHRESRLKGVVLWGLCDAASAVLMYAAQDKRVVGLILANPWVNTERGEALTRLRNYYHSRLFSRDLWRKIFSGRFDIHASLAGVVGYLQSAFAFSRNTNSDDKGSRSEHFVDRMRHGLETYQGNVFLILSGKDLTADEFRNLIRRTKVWRSLIKEKVMDTLELPEANHTFSSRAAKSTVETKTLKWIHRLASERL